MVKRVYLVGFRATGKSTLGKRLAKRLGFSFIDTDHVLCRQVNSTVDEIVAAGGWQRFRELEAEVLASTRNTDNTVIATGGGAILHGEFWQHHDPARLVVWLRAGVETLTARLAAAAGDAARPSLTGAAPSREVAAVLAEREPFYERYADVTVETDDGDIDRCLEAVLSHLAWRQTE